MSLNSETIEKTATTVKIKYPSKYKVIFFNDDKTPFDFVEAVLIKIFNKSMTDAQILALKIHNEGKAVIALYPKEIAMSKKNLVDYNSNLNSYPLRCEIESEDK